MEVRERRNHKDIGEVMGKGGETEDAVDHGRGRGARMRMRGTLDGPRVTSGRQVERSRPLPPPPPPPWCRHICRCLYCGRARQPWLLGGDAHPAGDGPSSGAWSIRGRPRRRGMGAAGILHARGTRELATVGAGGEKGGGEEKWRCHGDSGARKRERKMQPTEGGAHRCPPAPAPTHSGSEAKKNNRKTQEG